MFPGMTHLDVMKHGRRRLPRPPRVAGGGAAARRAETARPVAEGGGGRRVIVSDINPAMLSEDETRGEAGPDPRGGRAREPLARLRFVEGNAERLPFEAGAWIATLALVATSRTSPRRSGTRTGFSNRADVSCASSSPRKRSPAEHLRDVLVPSSRPWARRWRAVAPVTSTCVESVGPGGGVGGVHDRRRVRLLPPRNLTGGRRHPQQVQVGVTLRERQKKGEQRA